ncbi:hypothetical protein [Emticicia sp.]|uniref:hypothetical protein n=1 Tax=Emticicia sp. TaxID=1930953 RepID=UPI0037539F12
MHEIQQIGVLTFSRQKNHARWVAILLLLILIFFLLFAAFGEVKPNKTLNTPKTSKPISNPTKKV